MKETKSGKTKHKMDERGVGSSLSLAQSVWTLWLNSDISSSKEPLWVINRCKLSCHLMSAFYQRILALDDCMRKHLRLNKSFLWALFASKYVFHSGRKYLSEIGKQMFNWPHVVCLLQWIVSRCFFATVDLFVVFHDDGYIFRLLRGIIQYRYVSRF